MLSASSRSRARGDLPRTRALGSGFWRVARRTISAMKFMGFWPSGQTSLTAVWVEVIRLGQSSSTLTAPRPSTTSQKNFSLTGFFGLGWKMQKVPVLTARTMIHGFYGAFMEDHDRRNVPSLMIERRSGCAKTIIPSRSADLKFQCHGIPERLDIPARLDFTPLSRATNEQRPTPRARNRPLDHAPVSVARS